MFLPRRCQRRLLLPPGWVALEVLLAILIIGCETVRQAQRFQSAAGIQWPLYFEDEPLYVSMSPLVYKTTATRLKNDSRYNPFAELDTLRQWHDIDVVGSPLADFISLQTTNSAVQAIQADTLHAGGVRVRLHEHATYVMLVGILEIMSIRNVRYWLDVQHCPVVIYATTDKRLPYFVRNR